MRTTVTFPSNDFTIAGALFTPDGRPDGRLPGVVVSHPGGGVKEQSASTYAERLAREGFAALVFDAARQGESTGEPRGLEDPFQRAEDVKSAVTFLSTRAEVDPDRIGALGLCASGGYVPYAAQTDLRVRAVATVSAADMGDVVRRGVGRTQEPAVLREALRPAGELRTTEGRGEPVLRGPWAPDEWADAPRDSHEGETHEYYPRCAAVRDH
ncbi:alpha/beta hydrolase [Actinosynnema pretiosum]|uniref:alpha/beta hydrolase n=1 Tax=Actinosynnema pretiosum TaxID=42197 RepID=UPI001E53B855|nr:dienelactone hydrolase family protein [Actinosynnema pretiosum]